MNSIKKLNKNNERHAENKKKNVRRAGIVFLADFRRRRELYQKSWNRSRAWWICCQDFAGNENTLQVAPHLSLVF